MLRLSAKIRITSASAPSTVSATRSNDGVSIMWTASGRRRTGRKPSARSAAVLMRMPSSPDASSRYRIAARRRPAATPWCTMRSASAFKPGRR